VNTFEELLFDLENPVEATRVRAVVHLVRFNSIKAIPHLEGIAERDESAQVRYLARKGLKLLRDRALSSQGPGTTEDFARDVEEAVTRLTASNNTDDRRRGFELAARINDPSLFHRLEQAYQAEDVPFLKPMMLGVLAMLDGVASRPYILEALESPEHRLRASAVEAAGLIQNDDLLQRVLPLLRDQDNRVAANAAVALKDFGSIKVLEALEQMLESEDVNRRDSAAFALAHLKSEAALYLLVKASRDPAKTVRNKVVKGLEALAAEGSSEAAEVLEKILKDDEEGLADYFALAAADTTASYLAHDDFSVRLKAVKDIVKAADGTKLPALKEALKRERDTFVKSAIIRAVGELGTEDEVETITPYLIDRESRIRANAVEAAGLLAREDDTLKLLFPALKDKNNRVRANAAVAIKTSFPLDALETLREMAASGDVRMKLSATYACLEIGTDSAVGLLANLAREQDLRISEKAVSALALLRDRGSAAAERVLSRLQLPADDSPASDSFVSFEDGSLIRLTAEPDESQTGTRHHKPVSVASSLRMEYGIESGIDLLDPESKGSLEPLSASAESSDKPGKKSIASGIFTGLCPGAGIDKYMMAGEVGRGGMGVILNAYDTDIRREVAMKVITGRKSESREFLERFVEEAQVQGQLEHPNICPVHELGVDGDGRIYFTMKMVKGSSLAEIIKQAQEETQEARESGRTAGQRSLTDTLHIFLKICDGIAYAHSKGVIHRDLKPDNIMVGDFGEVYVMDWGLAKIIGRDDVIRDHLVITDRSEDTKEMKTMSGSVVGTPSYMPPEQSRGVVEEMDERSDIYSLGAVLYELVSLKRPFTGRNPWEILEKALEEKPPAPSQLSPELTIPPELDSMVLKCLKKQKSDRYQSIQELKHDIELFLSGRPIGAMEYNLWQVFRKWVERNRVLAASVITVLLVIVAAALISFFNVRQEMERAVKAEQEAIRQKNIAEEQQAKAVESEKKALDREEEALRNQEEALRNQKKSELNIARFYEEKGEIGEVIRRYGAIRRWMIDSRKNLFPFINLRLWKVRHTGGRYKEVLDTLVQTKHNHPGEKTGVYSVAISPDGKILAVGCHDWTVKLWNLTTRSLQGILKGHGKPVKYVTFSPDGTLLASGDERGDLILWDPVKQEQTAKLTTRFTPDETSFTSMVECISFSPDGTLMATSNREDKVVLLWKIGFPKPVSVIHSGTGAILSMMFSPDGKRLVLGSRDNSVRLCDLENDHEVKRLYSHKDDVNCVAFSPDGNLIASGSDSGTIFIWDLKSGRALTRFDRHGMSVLSLAFSPDGKTLISGSADRTVRFWDIENLEELASYQAHRDSVHSVAFGPGGLIAASGSMDSDVKIWSVKPRRDVRTINDYSYGDKIRDSSIAYSPDGKLLALGSSMEMQVPILLVDTVNWKSTAALMGHIGSVNSMAFTPDGTKLVSGGKNAMLIIWDLETGKPLVSINPRTGQQTDVFSAIIRRGFSKFVDKDVSSRTEKVNVVAVSPDGKLAAAGTRHRLVKVYRLDTEEEVFQHSFPFGRICAVSFSPDGTYLAAGGDYTVDVHRHQVLLWNVDTWEQAAVLSEHHTSIQALAFSPDGTLLAVGCEDGTISLWDVATRGKICRLEEHKGYVYSLSFSPDGRLLASGSNDTTIIIWDVQNRNSVVTLDEHSHEVGAVVFSPDGTRLVSGDSLNIIKVWDFGEAVKPLEFKGITK